MTVVCVNVLVALNTATNSVTKGDRVVRNFVLLQGICLLACFLLNFFYKMDRVSVDGITLATGWEVGRSNLGEDEIFCTRPDRP